LTEEQYKKFAKVTPLQRIGEGIDMAKAIVFLASSDAQFITGVTLKVDGGIIYNLPANLSDVIKSF
jgi:NAD(P)-dependent dehydrogenase (short-subunit alcohol dehydrogenase family)